jgi:hypothetical protein
VSANLPATLVNDIKRRQFAKLQVHLDVRIVWGVVLQVSPAANSGSSLTGKKLKN